MINVLLVLFLVGCALAVAVSRTIMSTIILFAAYSAVMSLLWLLLFAPDVAMTEAAIGVGVNSVVFVAVLSRIRKVSA
ncbi:MAG: hydrogenase subunit MbhD domain-containing protein [Spirochaetaceae bacterium]